MQTCCVEAIQTRRPHWYTEQCQSRVQHSQDVTLLHQGNERAQRKEKRVKAGIEAEAKTSTAASSASMVFPSKAWPLLRMGVIPSHQDWNIMAFGLDKVIVNADKLSARLEEIAPIYNASSTEEWTFSDQELWRERNRRLQNRRHTRVRKSRTGAPPKTRSGRVTRTTSENQITVSHRIGSQRTAPAPAETPRTGDLFKQLEGASDVANEPRNSVIQRKTLKRNPQLYEKTRASRRLAGKSPGFGILPSPSNHGMRKRPLQSRKPLGR